MESESGKKEKKGKSKGELKTESEAKRSVHAYNGFPYKTAINTYCFLRFPKQMLADLGWHAGMDIEIARNEDGSMNIQKANLDKQG